MKIVKVILDTNYGEEIEVKALVADENVKIYKSLIGKDIDLGDYYDDRSHVIGRIKNDTITVIDITTDESLVLMKFIGRQLVGPDLLFYTDANTAIQNETSVIA